MSDFLADLAARLSLGRKRGNNNDNQARADKSNRFMKLPPVDFRKLHKPYVLADRETIVSMKHLLTDMVKCFKDTRVRPTYLGGR